MFQDRGPTVLYFFFLFLFFFFVSWGFWSCLCGLASFFVESRIFRLMVIGRRDLLSSSLVISFFIVVSTVHCGMWIEYCALSAKFLLRPP
ncbi:hypothetical protein F9C07_1449939 [Aspergillus flavus]|uniref:Uncharacterized protein n=2 Tax=Aspergillus flavus TaxID=5059 RepID=A0A7U2MMJ9_ASPFN|nr:hypothetical protein BDV35DRAFT_375024 [Aspergillus flavus]QRD86431.1 hypothetical protein F9C07_1449939 [Aspergillus flavus]